MKHGLLRTAVLVGLSIAFGCSALAQGPRVLGGYKAAPVDDSEVVAAAEFAVGEQASKQETAISLVSVEKAERQVVAGTNFRLCLRVEVDDETSEAKVVVFKSLRKEYSLKSWEDGSCSGSEGHHHHSSRIDGHAGASTPRSINVQPANLLTDPEATFVGARVVHNVTVNKRKGMRVHAKFSVRY